MRLAALQMSITEATAKVAAEASSQRQPQGMRVNLERASVLVVDNVQGLEILSLIFFGFGLRTLHKARTVEEAKEVIQTREIDIVVMESLLPDGDAYDFVRWLRRSGGETGRFTPVLLLSAHTPSGKVRSSRDCGASFFVAKPVSPRVLLDRICWIAKEKRQFLETDTYVGPDRRFHEEGPPYGQAGRRREDPTEEGPPQSGGPTGDPE